MTQLKDEPSVSKCPNNNNQSIYDRDKEIKTQQLLRLLDTPVLQAFLQSAAELERRGTMGVGTSCCEGKPTISFSGRFCQDFCKEMTKVF